MTVADEIFQTAANPKLIAQVVHVYLANQRHGSAKALHRGEVYGSRRKLWRQKGTGRARHGDRFAPQFVGGGSAHGPTGQQNWRHTVNKKMRQRALLSVLSQTWQAGRLLVVDEFDKLEKTKDAQRFLDRLGSRPPILIVTKGVNAVVCRVMRNISGVEVISADNLNAILALRARTIVASREAIDAIQAHHLNSADRI